MDKLPEAIERMVFEGKSEWTYRVRVCRCAFEEVVVKAKTPRRAADAAERMPRMGRTVRYVTAPVAHSVEVLFEGKWVEIWKGGRNPFGVS